MAGEDTADDNADQTAGTTRNVAASAPGSGGTDDTELIKEWTIVVAGVLTSVAVGFSLFVFLGDAIDEALLSGNAINNNQGFMSTFAMLPTHVVLVPLVAIALSALVGVGMALQLDVDDGTLFKTVAASVAVGTVVSWVVGTVLGVNLVDVFGNNISLAYGGLIINSVVAGLAAAVASVASAWLVRNQTPMGLDVEASDAQQRSIGSSDD